MIRPKALFAIKSKTYGRELRTFDSVELSVDNIYEEDGLFCPLCGKYTDDECDGLQHDDYVTHPMLWNWQCCDCHCVLLENTIKKLTLKEAKKEFPQFADKLEELANPPMKKVKIRKTKTVRKKRNTNRRTVKGEKPKSPWYDAEITDDEAESEYEDKPEFPPTVAYLTLECAKIKRISNRQLYEYEMKNGSITDEETREFLSDNSRVVMDSLGIVERKKDKFGNCELDDNENIFDLSLPVDSYDAENPKVPYPENMDLAHDGIYIYVLCEDENGNEFKVCYWGD